MAASSLFQYCHNPPSSSTFSATAATTSSSSFSSLSTKKPAETMLMNLSEQDIKESGKNSRRLSPGKSLAEGMRSCILGSKCTESGGNGSSLCTSCISESSNGISVYQALLRYHNEIMVLDDEDKDTNILMKIEDEDNEISEMGIKSNHSNSRFHRHDGANKENSNNDNNKGGTVNLWKQKTTSTIREGRTSSSSSIHHSVHSSRSMQLYPKVLEEMGEQDSNEGEEQNEYQLKRHHNDEYNSLFHDQKQTGSAHTVTVTDTDTDTTTATATDVTTDLPAISSFYLSALEEATLTEEEEKLLLHQPEDCNVGNAIATINHTPINYVSRNNDSDDIPTSFTNKKTKSSFYLSALEKTACPEEFLEGELRLQQQEQSEEDEYSIAIRTSSEMYRVASSSSSSHRASMVSGAMNSQMRCYQSLDDNITSSSAVTRSVAIPFNTTSFLPTLREGEANIGSQVIAKNIKYDHTYTGNHEDQDDEDEGLRLALELSRLEATTVASFSDGISSCSLSTIEGERNCLARMEDNCHENNLKLDTNDDEAFLISQFTAIEEYKKNSNNDNGTSYGTKSCTSVSRRRLSEPSISTSMSLLSSDAILSSSLSGERRPRRRSRMETSGAKKTLEAISKGKSHAVKCQGCKGRLIAPVHFSLVFCPKCKTISPA